MAEWNWDWKKGLPPSMTVPSLFPSLSPMTDVGVAPSTSTGVPILPDVPKNRPPIVTGPGSAPNITAPGVTGVKFPSGMPLGDFTNPNPTQPADPDKTFKEKLLAALNNKDFMGGLALLAKAGTGKAPAPPPRMHMGDLRMGSGLPGHGQAAGAAMQQALTKMAGDEWDLTAPRKGRKPRHQDRYDILKGQ